MSRIGEWIRSNRLEADLTQSALGDEVGVHGSVVSRWENGHQDPSSECMELLERFFGRTFKGDGARGGDEEAASETDLKRLRDEIGTGIECIGTFDPEDEGSIPNHPGIYMLYSGHNNQLTSQTEKIRSNLLEPRSILGREKIFGKEFGIIRRNTGGRVWMWAFTF